MEHSREVGKRYEEMAADYLKDQGYQILDRNYHVRQGEIDIIAKDEKYLVFIEVKYRKTTKQGNPAEAVNFRKQRMISGTALFYLNQKQYSSDTPVRFDVITILGNKLTHIRDAFPFIYA